MAYLKKLWYDKNKIIRIKKYKNLQINIDYLGKIIGQSYNY